MKTSINDMYSGVMFGYYGEVYIKLSSKYLFQPEEEDFYKIETGSTPYDYDYLGYLAQGLC